MQDPSSREVSLAFELPPTQRTRKARATRSKYAPRACQECRRRRAKCNGDKPACSRCIDRGLTCIFSTNTDHRGSAPRSYVSLLQTRINLLEQALRLHSIDVDSSIAPLAARQPEGRHEPVPVMRPSPGSDLESPQGSQSIIYSQQGKTDDGECDAPFFGATSGRLELPAPSPAVQTENLKDLPAIISQDVYATADEQDLQPQMQATPPYRSPELIHYLIDIYFEWEQPWFQVVDEALFRGSLQNGGRYYSPLLRDCMLALASRYSDRTETRSDPENPNTAGAPFIQAAEARLQAEVKWPRITTVQSLSIMAIFYVAIGSDAAGWLHQGMAIRLSLDMGLNLEFTTSAGLSRLTEAEVQLRRQIYWSLYCSDKLWASYTGRDSQGSVPLMETPSQEGSSPNELTSSESKKTFLVLFLRHLSTQCQILERILTNLYAPKGLDNNRERRLFFENCFLDLQNWLFTLPKNLKVLISQSNQLNPSPHVYILNMCYHTCVILLAKPFLPGRGASTSLSEVQDNDPAQQALELCRNSAKEICRLGNRYRDAFGTFRRSPLTATHCTLTAALSTLFLGNGNRGDMKCCVSTLGELATSWAPSARYWRTLSRMLGAVHDPETRMRTSGEATTEAIQQSVHESTYSTQTLYPIMPSSNILSEHVPSTEPESAELESGALRDTPLLDFSNLDLDQLDFSPLTVLPVDYLNYNGLGFDF
uniref:Zn(2)-C6 fungal-type domain-containing protein n=1 Tax=Bionectria ochroleuca TaxID=29856 RepID=A0A0B7KL34_BIOOC